MDASIAADIRLHDEAQDLSKPLLRCPRCRGMLQRTSTFPEISCAACGSQFLAREGIPSLLTSAREEDAVKQFFDSVARRQHDDSASYVPFDDRRRDAQLRIFSRAFVRAVQRWVQPGARVLDVGCGHGALLEPVAQEYRLTGVDFAIDLLTSARKRGYDVYHADATALPFSDDQFDSVFCAEVLQHFADPSPLLCELARVCRPGGSVVLSTLNATSLVRLAGRMLLKVLRPTSLAVPILRRSAAAVAASAKSYGLECRQIAWVCSPSPAVVFTSVARHPVAPFATNFILCLHKPQLAER